MAEPTPEKRKFVPGGVYEPETTDDHIYHLVALVNSGNVTRVNRFWPKFENRLREDKTYTSIDLQIGQGNRFSLGPAANTDFDQLRGAINHQVRRMGVDVSAELAASLAVECPDDERKQRIAAMYLDDARIYAESIGMEQEQLQAIIDAKRREAVEKREAEAIELAS